MQPTGHALLSLGFTATISSLTIHHWAAAFCAIAVGGCAIVNVLDRRRKDRREAQAKTTTPHEK